MLGHSPQTHTVDNVFWDFGHKRSLQPTGMFLFEDLLSKTPL